MMVRNECDIIELSLRHAARLADEVRVIDHRSDDGTQDILEALSTELSHVSYHRVDEVHFNQSRHVTVAVNALVRENPAIRYIVPLDADEFLPFYGAEEAADYFRTNLGVDEVGLIPWITFCPVRVAGRLSRQSLIGGFRARRFEPEVFHKVVIGRDCAMRCKVRPGNHAVSGLPLHTVFRDLDIALQHVPIRSSQQIVCKALLGDYALTLNPARKRGEAFHWKQMAGKVRRNGYQVAQEELELMARSYALRDADTPPPAIDEVSRLVLAEGIEPSCAELQDIDLVAALDRFIGVLVEQSRDGFWSKLRRRVQREG